MSGPFAVAFSAIYAFRDGRNKYRILYCDETYLDNLTCEEACAHTRMLNTSCGMDDEEEVFV
ncbi:MAG: hypothetical protein GC165_07525 [Armatimonadetes bacterium]|nr:hypothetical protein [Armatimonadota bacterium]